MLSLGGFVALCYFDIARDFDVVVLGFVWTKWVSCFLQGIGLEV